MALLEDTFPEPISLLHRYVGDYYQTYDLFFGNIAIFPFVPALPKITGTIKPPIISSMYLQRIRPLHFNTEFDWLVAYRNYLFTIRDKVVKSKNPPDSDYEPIPLETYQIPEILWDRKFTSDRDGAIHYVVSHGNRFYGYHRQLIFEGVNTLAYPALLNSLIIEKPFTTEEQDNTPILEFSESAVERWILVSRFNWPTFSEASQPVPIDTYVAREVTSFSATSTTTASVVNTGQRVNLNWTCGTRPGQCQKVVYDVQGDSVSTLVERLVLPVPTLPRIKDFSIVRGTNNKYGQEPLQDIGIRPKLFAGENQQPSSEFIPVQLVFDEAQANTFGYKFVYNVDNEFVTTRVDFGKGTYFDCFFSNGSGTTCTGWGGRNLEYNIGGTGSYQVTTTVTRDYVLDPRPPGQQRIELTEPTLLDAFWLKLDDEDPLCLENVEMPDSPRLMEIHAALRADLFGQTVTDFESGNEVPRKTNLAWYLVSLCKFFGINYDKNGKNQMVEINGQTIKERRPIQVVSGTSDDPNADVTIKEGSYPFGCVGFSNEDLNTGELSNVPPDSVNSYPQFVYKVKSNQFVETEFGSTEIQSGDYVICYTFQHFMQTVMQDLDKAIGMANAGANAIPNADGSEKICTYEGLGTLVAENAYMLSSISRQSSQNLVSSLITQGLGLELLKATGYPLEFGEIKAKVAGLEDVSIPYPKLAPTSPTVNSQVADILNNLGPLIANLLCPVEE